MKICMLLNRSRGGSSVPLMEEVARLLTTRGAEVQMIYPEHMAIDLASVRNEHDMYVLKSKTETALSLAGALHSLGSRIVNPYLISEMCRNKIVSTRLLQSAGVPVPQTVVTSEATQLSGHLEDGPLVVKPYRGSRGRGVKVVRTPRELREIPSLPPIFAQRWHEPDGLDLKVYYIDGRIHGVQRSWPALTPAQKLGTPVAVPSEICEIAHACGRALGIDVFGFDVVWSNGNPYVVDLSSFPGFKGVPEAATELAEYLYRVVRTPRDRPSDGALLSLGEDSQ